MTITEAQRDLAIAEAQFAEAATPLLIELACKRIEFAQAQLNAVIAEAREGVTV